MAPSSSLSPPASSERQIAEELRIHRLAEQLHLPATHGLSVAQLEELIQLQQWKKRVDQLFLAFDLRKIGGSSDKVSLKEGLGLLEMGLEAEAIEVGEILKGKGEVWK